MDGTSKGSAINQTDWKLSIKDSAQGSVEAMFGYIGDIYTGRYCHDHISSKSSQ